MLPRLNVIDEIQTAAIIDAAMQVLSETGCKVMHGGALEMLAAAGASVDGERVRFPTSVIESALDSAPKGFDVFDRDGNKALDLRGWNAYYGTSTASPKTRDAVTVEIRPTVVDDIARGARVADALKNIDYVMPMGSAQDIPMQCADLHEFRATVTNTTKPIVFIAYSPVGLENVIKMAAAVRGGADALREKPFILSYPEPISPLIFPDNVVEKMLIAARAGIPQIPGTTVQPGTTGPVTLAGALVQLVAEGLVSLIIIQLASPGAPCFLSGNLNSFDMDTTLMSIASPEMSLGTAAHAAVARSLGLPSWGLAGSTDSKVLDTQAGMESAFSILAQGLAGVNLIHDVGYMDMAMVCSPEMLVMGAEAVGMARRFMQGIEVTPETLALDVIDKAGPGGNYLKAAHTRRHYREEIWFPSLFTRVHFNRWMHDGAMDMAGRARAKIAEILDSHIVPELDGEIIQRLDEIRDEGSKQALDLLE